MADALTLLRESATDGWEHLVGLAPTPLGFVTLRSTALLAAIAAVSLLSGSAKLWGAAHPQVYGIGGGGAASGRFAPTYEAVRLAAASAFGAVLLGSVARAWWRLPRGWQAAVRALHGARHRAQRRALLDAAVRAIVAGSITAVKRGVKPAYWVIVPLAHVLAICCAHLPQLRRQLGAGALLTPALISDPSLPFRLGATSAAAAASPSVLDDPSGVPPHAWSSLDGALEMVGLWPQPQRENAAAGVDAAVGGDAVTLDALGMGAAGVASLLAQGGRFDAGTAKRTATLLQAALLLRHPPQPGTAGGGGGTDGGVSPTAPSAWSWGLPQGVRRADLASRAAAQLRVTRNGTLRSQCLPPHQASGEAEGGARDGVGGDSPQVPLIAGASSRPAAVAERLRRSGRHGGGSSRRWVHTVLQPLYALGLSVAMERPHLPRLPAAATAAAAAAATAASGVPARALSLTEELVIHRTAPLSSASLALAQACRVATASAAAGAEAGEGRLETGVGHDHGDSERLVQVIDISQLVRDFGVAPSAVAADIVYTWGSEALLALVSALTAAYFLCEVLRFVVENPDQPGDVELLMRLPAAAAGPDPGAVRLPPPAAAPPLPPPPPPVVRGGEVMGGPPVAPPIVAADAGEAGGPAPPPARHGDAALIDDLLLRAAHAVERLQGPPVNNGGGPPGVPPLPPPAVPPPDGRVAPLAPPFDRQQQQQPLRGAEELRDILLADLQLGGDGGGGGGGGGDDDAAPDAALPALELLGLTGGVDTVLLHASGAVLIGSVAVGVYVFGPVLCARNALAFFDNGSVFKLLTLDVMAFIWRGQPGPSAFAIQAADVNQLLGGYLGLVGSLLALQLLNAACAALAALAVVGLWCATRLYARAFGEAAVDRLWLGRVLPRDLWLSAVCLPFRKAPLKVLGPLDRTHSSLAMLLLARTATLSLNSFVVVPIIIGAATDLVLLPLTRSSLAARLSLAVYWPAALAAGYWLAGLALGTLAFGVNSLARETLRYELLARWIPPADPRVELLKRQLAVPLRRQLVVLCRVLSLALLVLVVGIGLPLRALASAGWQPTPALSLPQPVGFERWASSLPWQAASAVGGIGSGADGAPTLASASAEDPSRGLLAHLRGVRAAVSVAAQLMSAEAVYGTVTVMAVTCVSDIDDGDTGRVREPRTVAARHAHNTTHGDGVNATDGGAMWLQPSCPAARPRLALRLFVHVEESNLRGLGAIVAAGLPYNQDGSGAFKLHGPIKRAGGGAAQQQVQLMSPPPSPVDSNALHADGDLNDSEVFASAASGAAADDVAGANSDDAELASAASIERAYRLAARLRGHISRAVALPVLLRYRASRTAGMWADAAVSAVLGSQRRRLISAHLAELWAAGARWAFDEFPDIGTTPTPSDAAATTANDSSLVWRPAHSSPFFNVTLFQGTHEFDVLAPYVWRALALQALVDAGAALVANPRSGGDRGAGSTLGTSNASCPTSPSHDEGVLLRPASLGRHPSLPLGLPLHSLVEQFSVVLADDANASEGGDASNSTRSSQLLVVANVSFNLFAELSPSKSTSASAATTPRILTKTPRLVVPAIEDGDNGDTARDEVGAGNSTGGFEGTGSAPAAAGQQAPSWIEEDEGEQEADGQAEASTNLFLARMPVFHFASLLPLGHDFGAASLLSEPLPGEATDAGAGDGRASVPVPPTPQLPSTIASLWRVKYIGHVALTTGVATHLPAVGSGDATPQPHFPGAAVAHTFPSGSAISVHYGVNRTRRYSAAAGRGGSGSRWATGPMTEGPLATAPPSSRSPSTSPRSHAGHGGSAAAGAPGDAAAAPLHAARVDAATGGAIVLEASAVLTTHTSSLPVPAPEVYSHVITATTFVHHVPSESQAGLVVPAWLPLAIDELVVHAGAATELQAHVARAVMPGDEGTAAATTTLPTGFGALARHLRRYRQHRTPLGTRPTKAVTDAASTAAAAATIRTQPRPSRPYRSHGSRSWDRRPATGCTLESGCAAA